MMASQGALSHTHAEDEIVENCEMQPDGTSPVTPSPSHWVPRRKSVSNACKRCRRRKIRCDGETPCSTCRKFSIICIRPPSMRERANSDQQITLEHRIRQLEARIAEVEGGPQNTNASELDDNASWPITPHEPPALWIDTSLKAADQSLSIEEFLSPNTEVPMIEVTSYDSASPGSISPGPSAFFLGAGSWRKNISSDTQSEWDNLIPPSVSPMLTPPMSAHSGPSWNSAADVDYLSPRNPSRPSLSRRSSVSSMALDYEPSSSTFAFPDFESKGVHIDESPRLPSRLEAETLSGIFFDKVHEHDCPIDRASFEQSMNEIYGDEWCGIDTHADNSYSMNMFHVFMVMAIGMRMKTEGRASEMMLLERCYNLAMQQTSSSTFWKERGALEAALLLAVFARLSGQRDEKQNLA